MEKARFEVLAGVMAVAATGDPAAVFQLYEQFGGVLAVVLRRELRRQGVRRVPADELDGLVLDACAVVFETAGGWDRRHGVPPWTWARHRLIEICRRWVGHHADPFDADLDEELVAPSILADGTMVDPGLDEVLGRLAAERDDCRVLVEALELLPARSRAILLELRLQACLGDPSPSVTVASEHGLRPDHVRQLAKRARDRLRTLAATEPRFAALADMALVA